MVVVSAGIRPNVDVAKISGLNVRRGILVNDDLSCRNDSDIFAIGECAEHRDVTYGLVAPLWEQASILADRLTERNPGARYFGSRVSTKLKVMGVELAVAGGEGAARRAGRSGHLRRAGPRHLQEADSSGRPYRGRDTTGRRNVGPHVCCKRSTGMRRSRIYARRCCSRSRRRA